jgi:phosphoribosyl-AMP cyclohydrolase
MDLVSALDFQGSGGLVAAIAVDDSSGDVLMVAWMNREAFERTLETGEAVYWSRSRQALWKKGETSGFTQRVKGVYVDCDGDVVLLRVEQRGGAACHTGRRSCFFRRADRGRWIDVGEQVFDPDEVYGR